MKSIGATVLTTMVTEFEFGRSIGIQLAIRLPKKPRKGVRYWIVESVGKPEWKDGKLSVSLTAARYDARGKRAR
jgi:hypothetical protein